MDLHRPKIFGHRGSSADAPENTLDAFALARAQGADGIELDVRRSADGALVLHHDAALPDGRLVAATPAAELPTSVPTLAAALDEAQGMVVNVEIKNLPHEPDFDPDRALADRVVELLAARGGVDDVLVSSFDLATVDRVRSLDPTVPTALLTFVEPTAARGVELAVERGHVAVHPHDGTVDVDLVAAARAAGVDLNVWTVDDPERIRALAALGVAGIVTNVPAVALAALER